MLCDVQCSDGYLLKKNASLRAKAIVIGPRDSLKEENEERTANDSGFGRASISPAQNPKRVEGGLVETPMPVAIYPDNLRLLNLFR